MTNWWRKFNRSEGGYEWLDPGFIVALISVVMGLFTAGIVGWLWMGWG